MEREVLKQDILDKIKSDPMLYGKVAFELRISPTSLPRLIYDNDNRLTQREVLKIIKNHLGIENESELLEVIPDSKDKSNTQNPQMQEADA